MPKVIDHAERRREVVDATWRIIVADGSAGVTMRRIAAELGLANGALRHYFPSRDSILLAVHARVIEQTSFRADRSTHGLSGLAALRALCLELMPVTDETVAEARVVVAFWAIAAESPAVAEQYQRLVSGLRDRIRRHVSEARKDRELSDAVSDDDVVDTLNWMVGGLQSRALLQPSTATPARQIHVLDRYLAQIARNRRLGTSSRSDRSSLSRAPTIARST